jgi:hypothetical protein
VWFNDYADGSKEFGIFVHGTDEFQAFYYNKDGKAMTTDDNDFEVSWTPDNFLKGAKYKAGDMQFEFITEARQAKADTTLVYWAEGRMVNLKEQRKPVKTFGLVEFFFDGK